MPSTRTFSHGYQLRNGTKIVGVRHNDLEISGGHKRVNGTFVEGGPFLVHHRVADVRAAFIDYTFDDGPPTPNMIQLYGYVCPSICRLWTNLSIPPVPAKPDYLSLRATAWGEGATGYRKARPGNPFANVFQYEVEARDEIKGIGESVFRAVNGGFIRRLRSAVGIFRGLELAGEEFLNYAFGWRPLLSDLRKMYFLQRDLHKKLDQIRRNNGHTIHRRREVSNVTDSSTTVETFSGFEGWNEDLHGMSNYLQNMTSSGTTVTKTVHHSWFAGAFRYYVPNIGSSQWTKRATSALFEGNITPSAIWEVLPWSWLIDWFTNVGDVISNMSANAVDNLASKYAYIMTTDIQSLEYTIRTEWPEQSGVRFKASGPPPATSYPYLLIGSYTIERTTKSRFDATPFGFGISYGNLSNYQYGILAALGLTRSHFSSTN